MQLLRGFIQNQKKKIEAKQFPQLFQFEVENFCFQAGIAFLKIGTVCIKVTISPNRKGNHFGCLSYS